MVTQHTQTTIIPRPLQLVLLPTKPLVPTPPKVPTAKSPTIPAIPTAKSPTIPTIPIAKNPTIPMMPIPTMTTTIPVANGPILPNLLIEPKDTKRVKTQYYPGIMENDMARALYYYLEENIEWEDGVLSKKGFTRKAKPMNIGMDVTLDKVIIDTLEKMGIVDGGVHGIYLNYYRDGNDWTPNHTHPGMKQVVISLGVTRTLTMGKGCYNMTNGDAIIFGSAIHGVPKDPNCTEGRISIALFLEK